MKPLVAAGCRAPCISSSFPAPFVPSGVVSMSTGWIVLGVIVISCCLPSAPITGWSRSAARQPGLCRHRRAAQAAPRSDPEPGRDREGLRRARARHARRGDQGPQRRDVGAGAGAGVGAAENQLSGALGKLIALSEAYPDLKANANFQQLASELSDIENKIAAAAASSTTRSRNTTPASSRFPPRCSRACSASPARNSSISAPAAPKSRPPQVKF